MDEPIVTFSFITGQELLEALCDAVPRRPSSSEVRSEQKPQHDGQRTERTKLPLTQAGLKRGRSSIQDEDGGDRGSSVPVEASVASASIHDDTSVPTSSGSTLHRANVVQCFVHVVDLIALRGRSETFELPADASASDLYEAVQWWIGEARVVLYDMDAASGRVVNVLTHEQPLGYLNSSGDCVHPCCTTSPPPHGQRLTPLVLRRRLGCHCVHCPVDAVAQWAVVHTFVPNSHCTHSSVALGGPAVVVPYAYKPDHPEVRVPPPSSPLVLQRVLQSAAFICCPCFATQRYYCEQAAMEISPPRDDNLPRASDGAHLHAPRVVLVGYPPLAMGDVVDVSGNDASGVSSGRTATRRLKQSSLVRMQITEATDSELTGFRLFYGMHMETGMHLGPFLCTQLSRGAPP